MVEEAILQVKGFKELDQAFEDMIVTLDHSSSALKNYSRKVAEVCLHFDKLPQDISEKEMNKYLADLARQTDSLCLSNFKLTIYGLRHFYGLSGLKDRVVELPSIKTKKSCLLFLTIKSAKHCFAYLCN